jgi:hypothetical protein
MVVEGPFFGVTLSLTVWNRAALCWVYQTAPLENLSCQCPALGCPSVI